MKRPSCLLSIKPAWLSVLKWKDSEAGAAPSPSASFPAATPPGVVRVEEPRKFEGYYAVLR